MCTGQHISVLHTYCGGGHGQDRSECIAREVAPAAGGLLAGNVASSSVGFRHPDGLAVQAGARGVYGGVLVKIHTAVPAIAVLYSRCKVHPRVPLLLLLLMLWLALQCPPDAAAQQDQGTARRVRIAVAQFAMETCTFCPNPTGVAQWEFTGPPQRGDSVLQRGSYIRGFVTRAAEYPELELVGIYSPRDPAGGALAGWVTTEAFDKYTGGIQDDLRVQGPFDGVYLALHGAMAVEGVPKPEAEIVRRVRQVVGDIPIVVTADLHANVDHELSDAANGVFMVKQFPHFDAPYQGERAARLLIRTIRGQYRPVMATRKPGVITPSVTHWTGDSPALDIMERARSWEHRETDVFVSVAFGFAYADVPDVGASVMVVTNNKPQLAERIAQDMSDYIWRVREQFFTRPIYTPEAGVLRAVQAVRDGNSPVLIADHVDRLGDGTWILRELIRQGASNFVIATLYDDRVVEHLRNNRVGDRVRIQVGGFKSRLSGEAVPIDGVIEFLGPWGPYERVAVLRFGANNRVILTPDLFQVSTPQIFHDLGIPVEELDVVVLKSRVDFRQGFADAELAGTIVFIDTPGWTPADLSILEYLNAPSNLYPISATGQAKPTSQ